jgi:purine nucleoside permease
MIETLLLALAFASALFAQTKPIPVKVVVVTMFERGEDTGTFPASTSYGLSVNISTTSLGEY